MDITTALEQGNGKAGSSAYLTPEEYIIEVGGVMIMCRDGIEEGPAPYNLLIRNDWQPYNPTPQIVPEKAGELWEERLETRGNVVWCTLRVKGGLKFLATDDGSGDVLGTRVYHKEIIHNQNGWERVFPEVKDEVERIEIDGVRWYEAEGNGATPGSSQAPGWRKFINRPPMKMILEIPKEDKC